ncbi:MAG: hypothetical protein GC161_01450 [Planctomycetaceae bacterium]|nr:hypothetical protein [Planctomycetaceae bacterium]
MKPNDELPSEHRDLPGRGDGDSKPASELPGPLSENWTRSTVENSRHSAAGMQFGLTIVVFAGGGYFLDRWLDSSPWCLLAAVALGFAGGLYSLLRQMPTGRTK